VVTETKKFVNVDKYYNQDKLHPYYKNFEMLPLFIMTAD
jgi:6-phosphofructokinase 1